MSCHIPGKTYCTGAQGNCRIRDWFLTQAQPHYQKSSTAGSCTSFSCFRPCPPTVHNAIVPSISWETHQLLHLRILLFLSLSLSLIMHVARASVLLTWKRTRNLKAPGSCRQLTFHSPLSRKHGAQTGRSRLTLRAQPSPSPSLHYVQQHAAFNDNSTPTLSKRMEKRACEERTFTNLRDMVVALWSCLLWIQRLMCALLLRVPPSLLSCQTRPSSTPWHQEPPLQRYQEVWKPPKEVQKCAGCCF